MRKKRTRAILLIAVGAVILLAAVGWLWPRPRSTSPLPPSEQDSATAEEKTVTFGPIASRIDSPPPLVKWLPSPALHRTAVLPTLDTPMPTGRSAVWCASFQMAWDRLRKDIAREPIRLAGAEEIADRLNRAAFPADAIVPENTWAVAGRYEEGIVGQIRKEMARRFPKAKLPRLEEPGKGVLAFAYLQSKVRFTIPFLNLPKGMEFRDSADRSHRVAGFGPHGPRFPSRKGKRLDERDREERRKKAESLKKLRAQVAIL
jgi:hypothetical protein